MSCIVKNLIEYVGIADYLPVYPTNFKELSLEEHLVIPEQKPDIEQIVKVLVKAQITDVHVIQTPTGTSTAGQLLTGWKAIIEGRLDQVIQYVADEETQTVHAAEYCHCFNTFIVLPATFVAGQNVFVAPYIEDITVTQIDKRNMLKCVTLLLDARII